jgi:hypothetical protein
VLAVIAGHMHRRAEKSARPLVTVKDEIAHVNAAMVPRIRPREVCELHHFVQLELRLDRAPPAERLRISERWAELLP